MSMLLNEKGMGEWAIGLTIVIRTTIRDLGDYRRDPHAPVPY